MGSAQLALFGREEPSFDGELAGIARDRLDATAWLERLPGWLRGHATLLEEMARGVAWEQTTQVLYEQEVMTPRLVASIGELERKRWPVLEAMARVFSKRFGVTFDAISAAYYRDGDDSVAWHRDRNLRQKARGYVATVSLGEPRAFFIRPRGGGAPSRKLMLGQGDLTIMCGTCQRDWEHAVPKVKVVPGPRISVMFRHSESLY